VAGYVGEASGGYVVKCGPEQNPRGADMTKWVWNGPRAEGDHIDAVLAALRLSADLHKLRPPAEEMSLLVVEARLDRELPAAVKRLYEFSDGMDLFNGNLNFVPAFERLPFRLLDYSEELRDQDCPIAQELIMFGGDGEDELYGLWYPPEASPQDPTPVIEVGELSEPDSMAVVGTDLPAFMRGWCGYRLAQYEAPEAALEAIGLPRPLWRWPLEAKSHAETIAPYLAWADPTLPRKNPDSYRDRLDVDGVRALLGQVTRP
jgi:hypothetical protein